MCPDGQAVQEHVFGLFYFKNGATALLRNVDNYFISSHGATLEKDLNHRTAVHFDGNLRIQLIVPLIATS